MSTPLTFSKTQLSLLMSIFLLAVCTSTGLARSYETDSQGSRQPIGAAAQISSHSSSERASTLPSDRLVQAEANRYAMHSAIAAYISLLVTGAGVIYVARTLNATNDALKQAREATAVAAEATAVSREIGQAQTRAYLSFTSGSYERKVDCLTCTAKLRNFGHSPAQNLRLSARLTIVETNDENQPTSVVSSTRDAYANMLPLIPAGEEASVVIISVPQNDIGSSLFQELGVYEHRLRISVHLEWEDVFSQRQFRTVTMSADAPDPTRRGGTLTVKSWGSLG